MEKELKKQLKKHNKTVKLGYNELGYNEQNEVKTLVLVILWYIFSVITNKTRL